MVSWVNIRAVVLKVFQDKGNPDIEILHSLLLLLSSAHIYDIFTSTFSVCIPSFFNYSSLTALYFLYSC